MLNTVIKIWSTGGGRGGGGAPWWSYWSPGITNTIGPAMGIEALKYISYPAQVLAKSSKMIPGRSLRSSLSTSDVVLPLLG